MSKRISGLSAGLILFATVVGFLGCSEGINRNLSYDSSITRFGFVPKGRLQGTTAFNSYAANDFTKIAFAGILYFAGINSGDNFLISTNGETWSTSVYSAGPAFEMRDAVYTNATYYVLSSSSTLGVSRLRKSVNAGIGFSYAGEFQSDLRSMVVGGGLGVAVGTNDTGSAMTIYSSTDMDSWTARTPDAGGTGTVLNRVIYAENTFVAVGDGGEIQVSASGTTWARVAAAGGFTGTFSDLAHGNSTFVAVGYTAGGAGVVQTSDDGSSWTARTPDHADEIYGIAYSAAGLFIAVGTNGIQTSADGISWTARSAGSGYAGEFNSVTCNGPKCVVGGPDGELQYSLDGITWTRVTTLPAMTPQATQVYGVASNAYRRIVVGTGGLLQTSISGENWTATAPAGNITSDIKAITYGGSAFVLVGDDAVIQSSPNGLVWTARTAAGGYNGDFNAITYGFNGRYIAVGSGGEVQTSLDGATWSAQQVGAINYAGAAASNSTVVIVGPSGAIRASTDLSTWNTGTPAGGYNGNFNAVVYGKNIFVAVGDNGVIQTSPNGVIWTAQTSNAGTSNIKAVTFNQGFFYAGGEDSYLSRSFDGVTWQKLIYDGTTYSTVNCIGGDRYQMVAGLDIFGEILFGIAQ